MNRKQNIRKLIFYLSSTLLLLAMGTAVTACGSEEEKEISLWDESYPEEIVERLVDAPAYVDTIMHIHKAYVCVFYSHDADMLDYNLGIDHSKIGMIAVKVKDIKDKGISFYSKVYVKADVTNRRNLNYDYADKVLHNTFDWEWGGAHIIPCKAILHDIRKRD